jgi:hypothetical protein
MPIYLACAGKDEKYRINFYYIHFIDGFAWATDGNILVKQSLDYYNIINKDCLNGKIIHKDYFQRLCQCEQTEAIETGIRGLDKEGNIYRYYPFETNITPSKFIENTAEFTFETKELDSITIVPKYIDIASKILYKENNESYLTLEFKGNMIKMTTEKRNDQFALILNKYV